MKELMDGFMKYECGHDKKVPLAYGEVGGGMKGMSGHAHREHLISSTDVSEIHVFLDAGSALPLLYCNNPTLKWRGGTVFLMPIRDQGVPVYMDEFKILTTHLVSEIQTGKRVIVSCIGGHGRTGTVLAILHGLLTVSATPIEDIRSQYCHKAIESWKQEKFIHTFLGLPIPKVHLKPCGKCKQNLQWLKANGDLDIWCEPCNVVWEAEKVKPMIPMMRGGFIPYVQQGQQALPSGGEGAQAPKEDHRLPSHYTQQPISRPGRILDALPEQRCIYCHTRGPLNDDVACLTCAFDNNPVPTTKPAQVSKNRWKRFLRKRQHQSINMNNISDSI